MLLIVCPDLDSCSSLMEVWFSATVARLPAGLTLCFRDAFLFTVAVKSSYSSYRSLSVPQTSLFILPYLTH